MHGQNIVDANDYPARKTQMQVSYPYIAYSGITPDNKELIIANIADKESPQRILHLMHDYTKKDHTEFICLVNSINE